MEEQASPAAANRYKVGYKLSNSKSSALDQKGNGVRTHHEGGVTVSADPLKKSSDSRKNLATRVHRDSPREEKLASVQSRGLASIGSTADTQALLDGLRKEFMQQSSNDKQQAEERANKERAYRQETEKDIKDVREIRGC